MLSDILRKSSTPKDAQKRMVRAKELGMFADVSIVPLLFDNLNYLYVSRQIWTRPTIVIYTRLIPSALPS